MKFNRLLIVVLLGFFLSGVSFGATVLSSCGVINESGRYILTGNLVIPSNVSSCFDVRSTNIEFDCLGFKISGSGVEKVFDFGFLNHSSSIYVFNCKFEEVEFGDGTLFNFSFFNNLEFSSVSLDLGFGIGNFGEKSFFSNSTFRDSSFFELSEIEGGYFEGNKFYDDSWVRIGTAKNSYFFLNVFNSSQESLILDSDGGNEFYTNMFYSDLDFMPIGSDSLSKVVSGNLLGNYWRGFSCDLTQSRGGFNVCLCPANYSYVGKVDSAPLMPSPVTRDLIWYDINSTYNVGNFSFNYLRKVLNYSDSACYGSNAKWQLDVYLSVLGSTSYNVSNIWYSAGVDSISGASLNRSFSYSNQVLNSSVGWSSQLFFNSSSMSLPNVSFGVVSTPIVVSSGSGSNLSNSSSNSSVSNVSSNSTGSYLFKLELENNFEEDEEISCDLNVNSGQFNKSFSFDENTRSANMTLKYNFSSGFIFDCDENFDEILFTITDSAKDEIYSKTYKNEDRVSYAFPDGLYKATFEFSHDFDEDEEIECDFTFDENEFSERFDESSSSSEMTISKYFQELAKFSCDAKVDDVDVLILDDEDDEVVDKEYSSIGNYTYGNLSSGSESVVSSSSSYKGVVLSLGSSIESRIALNSSDESRFDLNGTSFRSIYIRSLTDKSEALFRFTKEKFTREGKNVMVDGKSLEMAPNYEIYEVLSVEHPDVSNSYFEDVIFEFSVSKVWLYTKGISFDRVVLVREEGGVLSEIKPEVIEINEDSIVFNARSSGFSTYTIVGKGPEVLSGTGDGEVVTGEAVVEKSADVEATSTIDEEEESVNESLAYASGEGKNLEDGTEEGKGIALWMKIVGGFIILVVLLWILK